MAGPPRAASLNYRGSSDLTPKIKLCLFDLDYTLIRLKLDPRVTYAEVLSDWGFDVDSDELEGAYLESWDIYLRRGFEFPTDREAYAHSADHTLGLVGIERDRGRIVEEIMRRSEVSAPVEAYDDSIAFVRQVRDSGLRTGIATGRWHDPSSDLELVGLGNYMDVVYHAGMLGMQKDAAGFWLTLLEREGLKAGEAVLIDDNAEAVAAARATGITASRIQRPDSPIGSSEPADMSELSALPSLLESR